MIRVQLRIVCFLPSFIYQLKLHFSWIFIFTLILIVCYLFRYSILGVYGYCSRVNDAGKTDTLVNSPKGEKVCWQINQYPSPDLRTIKNKTGSCGQKQTRAEVRIFFTGCFQGAHGWNYFNENDQFPPFLTLEFNLGERQLIRFFYGILQKKYLQFESIGHSEYRGVLQGEAGSPFPIPLIPGLDPPKSATDLRIMFIVYFTLEHRKNNAQVRKHIHHHESCTTITWGIDPRVMFIYISFMPERFTK